MVDIMASNFWKGRYNLMNIYVGIDIAKHNHFAAAISFNTEIIIEPFNFSSQQKNPGNLAVPGHLTFGHMYLAVLNIFYIDRSANLDFATLHLGRAFAL